MDVHVRLIPQCLHVFWLCGLILCLSCEVQAEERKSKEELRSPGTFGTPGEKSKAMDPLGSMKPGVGEPSEAISQGDLQKAQTLLESKKPGPAVKRGSTEEQGAQSEEKKAEKQMRESETAAQAPQPVPSALESLFGAFATGATPEVGVGLAQFGYGVFMQQTGFLPSETALVGPDYVLGPGDEFTVTLWGLVDANYPVRVSPKGTVVFPKIGELPVAGVTYGDLQRHLELAFGRHFRNFNLSVSMGRLRGIQVFIVGEVQQPGSYTISSLSTAFTALFAAGGPTKSGTLRAIQILRAGKVFREIDLYGFLLHGDKSQDIRLQEQDTVFVPLIGPVVGVSGHVHRPAIYELRGNTTLGDVLALAGEVKPTGYLGRVQIERTVAHQRRVGLDLNLSEHLENQLRTPIQNMDLVKVFPISSLLQEVVYLQGHVLRPGPYAFRPGMRVSDLVPGPEALLPETYLDYARIIRLLPVDHASAMTKTVIPFSLRKALAGEPSADVALQSLDQIIVSSREEFKALPSVQILGEVRAPGNFPLLGRMRASDLVFLAGGLTGQASFDAELTRYRVEDSRTAVEIHTVDLTKALGDDPTQNVELQEFDILVVRPIPESTVGYTVTIQGEVKRPGVYTITKGERLSSVLRRAGGLTSRAYPRGTIFIRESVKRAQQEALQKLGALHAQHISAAASSLSLGGLERGKEAQKELLTSQEDFPKHLRSQITLGRLVVRVDVPEQLEGSSDDLVLEDKDSLEIPPIPQTVSVVGSVRNPTAVLFSDGADIMEYISRAGGLTPDAGWENTYVLKADGSAKTLYPSSSGVSGIDRNGLPDSLRVDPGDVIIVPPRVEVVTRPVPTWQTVPDPYQTGIREGGVKK